MTSLETLIEPLRHSPQLLEAVDLLQQQIEAEKERRDKFYEEMTPEQKIEFIDGEVVLHSPARKEHLDATKLILKLLDTYVELKGLGTLMVEKCLCVFPRNDYEPDIVFFGKDKAAELDPKTLKFPVPDLAVEVLSDSTQTNDRGVKFEDYAANGVGEYWIVDAEKGVVKQYVLTEEGYDLKLKSSNGRIQSTAIPGFATQIEAFFDTAKNLAALKELMDSRS